MALVVKDRVKETSTTTGTSTLTLAGAADGFQSFAAVGDGNTTYYAIVSGNDYEVGLGTYTASGTTLSRTTILESSNSGSALNLGVGTKDVFVTYPAEKSIYADSNDDVNVPADLTSVGGIISGAIFEHTHTIASNYTITSGNNAISAGPLTVNSGVSVTVPSGSSWKVV
jgi:hypothetical protein